MTMCYGVVYKGLRIVVPPAMRQNMSQLVHHLGIVKSKQRAHKVLYWPDMSAEIEEVVKSCSKCAEIQNKLLRKQKPQNCHLSKWPPISLNLRASKFANRQWAPVFFGGVQMLL